VYDTRGEIIFLLRYCRKGELLEAKNIKTKTFSAPMNRTKRNKKRPLNVR
jgi:hypothetical protein